MKILRFGICALAAFSVLAFGAVEVWSQTILEIGTALLVLWWAVLIVRKPEMAVHWNPLYWPLLIFAGLAAMELVFGTTAYPFYTRVALLELSACVLLFFLSCQAFQERRELRSFVWFLMCFGFAVAVFGLIQSFTSNDKLYWVRPLTAGGNPFGPYVNRNHFAGLMELLAPLGLSLLLFRGVRREQMSLVGVLTILPVAALFLSGSRGGIASFFFEIGLLAVIVQGRKTQKLQRAAVAAVLFAAIVASGWLGANKLFERFTQIHSGEVSLERRWTMAAGTWHIFLDHPILGTGLGALVDVYPRYETYYDGKIVDHAHDDYVELLAETGLAGGLCGLAFFWIFFREAWALLGTQQSSFSLGLHAGALSACSGMMVHSFVDFNLHIPANGLLFLLLTSLAVTPALPPRTRVAQA
ncbi:MAG TPA: O-antigen ligase family protein [Candidatus Acidoferrales bacterium]|nr:O-antigen ligase family protein [Candidatus Acidoferrales bacterium]